MQRDDAQEVVKKGKGEKSAVQVMVRVRPFSSKELKREDEHDVPISVISMEANRVDVVDQDGVVKESFEFHHTFWSIPESQKQLHVTKPFSDQQAVFEVTGIPAVQSCLKGYHTCIFAYGQTGSGKTHTMLGSQTDPGVAPRLIENLFSELEGVGNKRYGYKYSVEISFMEIYNENVKDLFGDATDASSILRNKKKKSIKEKEPETLEVPKEGKEGGEGNSKTQGKPKRRKSAAPESKSGEQEVPSRATKRRQTVAAGVGDEDPGSATFLQPTRKKSAPTIRRASKLQENNEQADAEYRSLRVRQSPTVGTFVEGLSRLGEEQGITTATDVKKAMLYGMNHRATAATQMNDTSSRSHAIFQICVKACNRAKGIQRYAHINLVDLAGSERIKMSGAAGDRFTEATRINLSLGTLRRVIDALIENAKRKTGPKVVPPYRDAMLTWILSESLGGNSKTMMIATVSPAESNREDSTNTLRYALKAKAIVNTVRVNEQKVSVVVSAMMKEMQELRDRLEDEASMNPESQHALQTELKQLEDEYSKMEYDRQVEEKALAELGSKLEEQTLEAQKKAKELEELQAENVEVLHEEEKKNLESKAVEIETKRLEMMEASKVRVQKEMELLVEKQQQDEIKEINRQYEDRKEAFRQETLVVKRKQFALAFHKAFKQTKTSSSKDRMERELQATSNRISHSHLELEWKKQLMRDVQRDNINLEDRIKAAEREYLQMDSYRGDKEERLSKEIKEAQVVKKEQDSELLLLRAEIKKHQSTLYMVSERKAKDSHMMQERFRHSALRLDSVKNESERKNELLEQLEQQKRVMEDEVKQLHEEIKEMEQKTNIMRQTIGLKSGGIADMKKKNIKLEKEVDDAVEKNEVLTRDLCVLHAKCMDLKEESEAKESDHDDLRQYVSFRFFPSGKGEKRPPPANRSFERSHTTDQRTWSNGGYTYTISKGPLPSPRYSQAFPSPRGPLSARQSSPRSSTFARSKSIV